MPNITKKFFLITVGLFLFLLIFLSVHNLRTFLTGKEDKVFYLLFIILFFLTPAFFLFSVITWIVAAIKEYLIGKKKEYEQKLIEKIKNKF